MAIASDLKVGQAVRVHGRNAVLESVDPHEMTGLVRWEDGETLVVLTADVSVATPGQVAEMETSRKAGVRGPLGDRAATPTKAQIDAARKAAADKVRGEHMSAAKLEAVQDEAEAELVAKMARGEVV